MEFTPKILSKLKKGDRTVQKLLYDDYSAYFFGILRRYVKTQEDAEDLLCTAFYKIMTKVDQLDEPAKMHGWMKRIVINEALMFLRSKKNLSMHLEMDENLIEHDQYILPKMYADDILEMVDTLPDGYRTVFNLYAIEGYKHKEIAEELGISIHTSKTQYMMAKKRLVEMLKKTKLTMNKETHHIKAEAEKIKINPSHKVWEKLELQLDNTSLRKSYHQLALKYAASLLFLVSIGLMLYIVYKPTLNTRVESFTYDMEIDQQYRYMFESLRNVSFENTSEENYNHSNFDL